MKKSRPQIASKGNQYLPPKGYSEEWITQRMRTIETRKELTAEWKRVGVNEGIEYAILQDDITKAWSGMSTKEYKQYKGLKKKV